MKIAGPQPQPQQQQVCWLSILVLINVWVVSSCSLASSTEPPALASATAVSATSRGLAAVEQTEIGHCSRVCPSMSDSYWMPSFLPSTYEEEKEEDSNEGANSSHNTCSSISSSIYDNQIHSGGSSLRNDTSSNICSTTNSTTILQMLNKGVSLSSPSSSSLQRKSLHQEVLVEPVQQKRDTEKQAITEEAQNKNHNPSSSGGGGSGSSTIGLHEWSSSSAAKNDLLEKHPPSISAHYEPEEVAELKSSYARIRLARGMKKRPKAYNYESSLTQRPSISTNYF